MHGVGATGKNGEEREGEGPRAGVVIWLCRVTLWASVSTTEHGGVWVR